MSEPAPEAPSRAKAHYRIGLTLGVAAVVIALDQLTKWWALERLSPPDGPIDVIWTLRFNLTFNSGMAFSQGRGLGPIIGTLALVVVVVLVVSVGRGTSTLGAVAIGLVVGGAVGNLSDRLFRSDERLPAGQGHRLHRRPVVARVQRGRRGRRGRRPAAGHRRLAERS